MAKLSIAQKKMIARLESGRYTIGLCRYWYDNGCGMSKANDATIEFLIANGILVENGTQNKLGYSVTLTGKKEH